MASEKHNTAYVIHARCTIRFRPEQSRDYPGQQVPRQDQLLQLRHPSDKLCRYTAGDQIVRDVELPEPSGCYRKGPLNRLLSNYSVVRFQYSSFGSVPVSCPLFCMSRAMSFVSVHSAAGTSPDSSLSPT
jgi:hypothetical protein